MAAKTIRSLCLLIVFLAGAVAGGSGQTGSKSADLVTLIDEGTHFTLSNGIVTAKINKDSAALVEIKYKGLSLLGGMGIDGYWTLPATNLDFGRKRTASIILNPSANKGERAIVSCKFVFDGDPKTVPSDVEMRYSLARGDSALYLEEIWDHRPEYPKLTYPVGRFVAKLNDDIFDWMTIDSRRSMQMITAYDWNHGTVMNVKEARLMNSGVMKGQVEHKYDYAAVQF